MTARLQTKTVHLAALNCAYSDAEFRVCFDRLLFASTRGRESGESQADKRKRAGFGDAWSQSRVIGELPIENVLLLEARARTACKADKGGVCADNGGDVEWEVLVDKEVSASAIPNRHAQRAAVIADSRRPDVAI